MGFTLRDVFLRAWNRDVSKRGTFIATDTAVADACPVPSAKHTLYIQKIVFDVTTSAAQSMTFQDDAGTPVVIATIPSGPGVGPQVFDFGDDGIPLTKGKNLDIATSGAGLAGRYSINAYAMIDPGTAAIVPADL
jgi:hypothetical protein